MVTGCATVEIAAGKAPTAQATHTSEARTLMRRKAKTLRYVFAQKGWSPKISNTAQSAASVLLEGLKPSAIKADNAKDYILKTSSRDAVLADVELAEAYARETAAQAFSYLNANPDVSNVRTDLKLLEDALMSARQAEMTFEKALNSKGDANPADAMTGFNQAVESLKSITNSYGVRQRGGAATGVTG